MKSRCTNAKMRGFKNYGGRGIRVCERWKDFIPFLTDMGERPEGHSIERKDVNGNYEPSNCIWLPTGEQNNNQRRTLRVIVNGKTMSACGAARVLEVKWSSLIYRIHKYGTAKAMAWAQGVTY